MDLRSMTPRQQVFHELVQTEANYTAILKTILDVFKKNLEDPNIIGGQILNQTEIKIIFGNLPPIYEIHSKMLAEFYQVRQMINSLAFKDTDTLHVYCLKKYLDATYSFGTLLFFFSGPPKLAR
jgi:hypothetical protein